MPYPHLSEKAKDALQNKTLEERIHYIQEERWIGYEKAHDVIDQLTDLLNYPKRTRMPNLLIIGDTNNGKTMIALRFLEKYPPSDNLDGDNVLIPVLYIQAPPIANRSHFYSAILDRLYAPYRATDRADKKQTQVLNILRKAQLGMIIIDEIQHIISGSTHQHIEMLNTIKYLGNELMVPIIGVGTKEALTAIHHDPQLSNRFDHVSLKKWPLDDEFTRLLMTLEYTLPLRLKSNLHDIEIARKIHSMGESTLGEFCRLVSLAAVDAVKSGEEQITLKTLKNLRWTKPSERKKLAKAG